MRFSRWLPDLCSQTSRPRRLSGSGRADFRQIGGPFAEIDGIEGEVDIVPMVEAFRLAFSNLQEIWSLVLAPNSLLGLKRLSVVNLRRFVCRRIFGHASSLIFWWLTDCARSIVDTCSVRSIPLYLAWVAGHLNVVKSGTSSEVHVEAVAAAFESDKQYIVSRWRWPDRFNS